MPKPLVIAHRGDSSRALENSLDAFRLALSLPVDMIEFDVRKSRDNVLYVMHDKETGRTADGSLDIEKAVSDDISRLRLKNGEAIPTLNDVLTLSRWKGRIEHRDQEQGRRGLDRGPSDRIRIPGARCFSRRSRRGGHWRADECMPDVPVAGILRHLHTSGSRARTRPRATIS